MCSPRLISALSSSSGSQGVCEVIEDPLKIPQQSGSSLSLYQDICWPITAPLDLEVPQPPTRPLLYPDQGGPGGQRILCLLDNVPMVTTNSLHYHLVSTFLRFICHCVSIRPFVRLCLVVAFNNLVLRVTIIFK